MQRVLIYLRCDAFRKRPTLHRRLVFHVLYLLFERVLIHGRYSTGVHRTRQRHGGAEFHAGVAVAFVDGFADGSLGTARYVSVKSWHEDAKPAPEINNVKLEKFQREMRMSLRVQRT